MTSARVKTEIESAGSANSSRFAIGCLKKETYERDGTQWKTREVKMRRSVASQKLGTLIPTRPATPEKQSTPLSRRTAESTPSGTPTTSASPIPRITSSMSIGSALPMIAETGCWESRERPRLPWKACEIQRQYCSGYEPVSPSCFSAAAISCGVAVLSPAKKRSRMFPGRKRTARKMMIETAVRVATSAASLWATKRAIGATVRRHGSGGPEGRPAATPELAHEVRRAQSRVEVGERHVHVLQV